MTRPDGEPAAATGDTPPGTLGVPVADDGRIVFVGGLHRSGTTPLSRWLGSHPEIAGLTATGVPEDEGQHLQRVYPTAREHGGPGRFALHPAARLTESFARRSPGAAEQLIESWAPYWDTSRRLLLEKSPPNLIRMRFLRELFPRARFVMIVRHPVAVALATRKGSSTNLRSLIAHWVAAHRDLVADANEVGRVALVRYEDLMTSPDEVMAALFGFLEVAPFAGEWSVNGSLNARYFAAYRAFADRPRGLADILLAQRHTQAVRRFGYGLLRPAVLERPAAELAALMPPPPRDRQRP